MLRKAAAEGLCHLAGTEARDSLKKAAQNEKDSNEVRAAALTAMGHAAREG